MPGGHGSWTLRPDAIVAGGMPDAPSSRPPAEQSPPAPEASSQTEPETRGPDTALALPQTVDVVGPVSPHTIAVFSVLVAAAGFVPVPFLDDLLPRQLVRQLIRTILRRAERRYALRFVKALYAPEGCLSGCLDTLVSLVWTLLAYPIRKVLRVIQGIRSLSQRLVSTYMLGHTVNRYVALGWFDQRSDARSLGEQAAVLRRSFDLALETTNPVVFSSSVTAVLGGLRGLPRAAWRAGRALVRGSSERDTEPTQRSVDPDEAAAAEPSIENAAARVESALAQPEVQSFVAEFDATVDREVERQYATKPGGAPPLPVAPPPEPTASSDAPTD